MMKTILFTRTFAVALVLAVAATGLWAVGAEEEPAAAADKKYVTDPTTGKVVTAPEYGGTLTYAKTPLLAQHTDTYGTHTVTQVVDGVVERLAMFDWGMDRDVWDLRGDYVPMDAATGQLAESWEMPDDTTIIFNIRKGVYWHDKAPVNGRELTAQDVEHNYHRILGLGSGYTEKAAVGSGIITLPIESVTATDKWTVVIKLSQKNVMALKGLLLNDCHTVIYPPEIIEEHGDAKDWRNLVGTGPMMLTDWTQGSSLTWTRNPNYWGYDAKYPENRLPYVDELRALIMPEEATRLAAMRTGQIDLLGSAGGTFITSIDQAESLQRTNPEIEMWPFFNRSDHTEWLNVRKPPFDDLRVRQAMHMALDFEAINDTWFKGYAERQPQGPIGRGVVGHYVPFDEWPEDIKKHYTYDPAGAEALLDAAGYPRGADGIRFTTTLTQAERFPLGYKELKAAYWAAIGVNVEIDRVSDEEWIGVVREGTADSMVDSWAGGQDNEATTPTEYYRTDSWVGAANANDPAYDALHDALKAAATTEEQMRLAKETDMYVVKNHWIIWGLRSPKFNVNQPWLMGYNGELALDACGQNSVLSRLWIDQDLKKEMGY